MTQDTKEKIITIAQKLFGKKGYHGTSIREISKEAGVSLSMINYHYGSKQRLFNFLVQTFFSELETGTDNILLRDISARQKLDLYVDLFVKIINKDLNLARILSKELIIEENEELALWLVPKIKKNNDALKKIIQYGIENEGFELKVDINFLISIPTAILVSWLKGDKLEKFSSKKNLDFADIGIEALKEDIKKTMHALV